MSGHIPIHQLFYPHCFHKCGMLAGLGGTYLSLSYTPGWRENMTSGQEWIAIAMVMFALWIPWRAALNVINHLTSGSIRRR